MSVRMGRPPKTTQSPFGMRLQKIRRDSGLSQREVAAKLGISQPAYGKWERRDIALTEDQLNKLANILAVEVGDLFSDNPKRRGPTGRVRQVFDKVSQLPRKQQEKILDVIEPFISEHAQQNS